MIDFSNGRANMAYVGETPWHGLGFKLPAGATVDDMTIAAGLTYDVIRAPMQYVVDNEVLAVDNRAVLYRNDTKAPLGFVAPGYKIVQPRDVMDLFRTVCAKSGFEMETAGSLAGGSRVWALAKMTDGAYVVDKDEVRPYLLMATSFDGTLATTAKLTAVRVVCQNTLSLSTMQDKDETDKNTVKVYHSQAWDQDAALEQLGVYTSSWQKFMINTKRMAERTLTQEIGRAHV
jgi:phage/plasmid-like protein (TIGR03299 family)